MSNRCSQESEEKPYGGVGKSLDLGTRGVTCFREPSLWLNSWLRPTAPCGRCRRCQGKIKEAIHGNEEVPSDLWPLLSSHFSLSVSSSADSALWWETCGQRFPPSNSQGGLTLPGTEFPLSGLDERQDPPVVHWVKELPSGLFLFSETIVDKPKLHADSTPTAYPSQVIY